MSLSISDIKRAFLNEGDVSVFADVYRRSLGGSLVRVTSALNEQFTLTANDRYFKKINNTLCPVISAWTSGRSGKIIIAKDISVNFVTLPPQGKNAGKYLERIFDELKPEIVVIDTPPIEFAANAMYAFSLACALGLPVNGDIQLKDNLFYAREPFFPGDINEVAIIKCWQNKIPLLPVGVPQRKKEYIEGDYIEAYFDTSHIGKEIYKSKVLAAYQALDESLAKDSSAAKDICESLMKSLEQKDRETLVEEGAYVASRIAEVISKLASTGQRPKILAILDPTHYSDTGYTLDILKQGITEEVYFPPKSYADAGDMIITFKQSNELDKQAGEKIPQESLAQRLFEGEFKKTLKEIDSEILTPAAGNKLITTIVSHTRTHPDIVRGASVRGTLAFKEIVDAFAEVKSGLTREAISRAALITLPPRINARHGLDEIAIVDDIVKQVLYGIRFSSDKDLKLSSAALNWLSPQDIVEALKNMDASKAQKEIPKGLPTVIAGQAQNKEMLKFLEKNKFLKRSGQEGYTFTRKAVENLLNELEQRLKQGRINLGEYNREKERLTKLLGDSSRQKFNMSAKELARTIMELMDAQDKQWGNELSFERMHIYYHVRGNSGETKQSPQKQDYYSLKTLIDDLEERGILRAGDSSTGFTVTGDALGILLEYLVEKIPGKQGLQDAIDSGKVLSSERKHEIRRYSSGDFFRDISVRHTLREIAKQRKALSNVRKSDFRVFMKLYHQPQSDIVLCLDTSASMGSRQKLIYARLVATGLAKAAIENSDRVGLVTFDNFGQTTIPLTDKSDEAIVNCIVGLSARGNTNVGDGIKCAAQVLFRDRNQNQKHILLITDGQPTAVSQGTFDQFAKTNEKDVTEEAALMETRQASAKGVRVSVIHIAGKEEASSKFIRNIARYGKGKFRRIGSPEDLETIM